MLAEHKHRHIVELSLATMHHASIPLKYWDQIFIDVVFVINRIPSLSASKASPFEILFKQQPDYSFLRIISCECYPLLRPYNNYKLQPRSLSCVFMGYSTTYKRYCCFHIASKKKYISRHVRFNEKVFPFAQPPTSTEATGSSSPQLTVIPPATSPYFSLSSSLISLLPSVPHPTSPLYNSIPSSSASHSMLTKHKTNSRKSK
jgi:hypothetical protein